MMAKTGMLIVTNPCKFNRIFSKIKSEVKNTLYIHFYPYVKPPVSNVTSRSWINSSSVIDLYKDAIDIKNLDVRVLLSAVRDSTVNRISTRKPIEVVFFDRNFNQDEMKGFLTYCVLNKTQNCQTISLNELDFDNNKAFSAGTSEMYNSVVLGGTFDRLHVGHKILLSEAILRCNKKLTVGVTDINMLKTKKLWEIVEPCNERIERVREFLEDVEPNLDYDIIPINDVYGPTKSDPTFELLVVSAETLGGAKKVNEVRVTNGLKPLEVHSVELIPDVKLDEEEEDKVSSSNERLRLLGTLLSEPEPRPHLPPLPYIIGLTGGIASGKSSLSKSLQGLGAGIVDCDKIAHQLYVKDSPIYFKLLDGFGYDIRDSNGEISRKKLGEIVFNNKAKLEELNNLLWPSILERSKEIAEELYKAGHRVVVLEGAVLIKAGWDKECHEVWASIIPTEEAVNRLKARDGLSEEEALLRISSQPSNEEFVSKANVVFCTLWRPEYSQKQVLKAWNELKDRLPL